MNVKLIFIFSENLSTRRLWIHRINNWTGSQSWRGKSNNSQQMMLSVHHYNNWTKAESIDSFSISRIYQSKIICKISQIYTLMATAIKIKIPLPSKVQWKTEIKQTTVLCYWSLELNPEWKNLKLWWLAQTEPMETQFSLLCSRVQVHQQHISNWFKTFIKTTSLTLNMFIQRFPVCSRGHSWGSRWHSSSWWSCHRLQGFHQLQ